MQGAEEEMRGGVCRWLLPSSLLRRTLTHTGAMRKMKMCFIFFFAFSGPYLSNMKVPSLGAELELQPLAYAMATANAKAKPRLQPTPQLTAMPEP